MKRLIWLFTVSVLAAASACAQNNTPPPAPSAQESASSSASEAPSSSAPEPSRAEDDFAVPIDAALYRGVVTSMETPDNAIRLVLKQAEGTDFGAAERAFLMTENTRTGFGSESLMAGSYVEAYYGAGSDAETDAEAIALRILPPADLCLFNGTLEEYTPGDSGGDLRLKALDGENEIVFHYGDETRFYLDFDELAQGDKLNVYFNGATTRSQPPQATALEVRPYAEPR